MQELQLLPTSLHSNPQRETGNFFYVASKEGRKLCTLRTWAFDSCGIWELHGMWGALGLCKSAQDLVDFCQNIETAYKYMPNRPDSWFASEFLLSLSESIHPGWLKEGHQKIKCIDSFLNRAHGPNKLFLYRISL